MGLRFKTEHYHSLHVLFLILDNFKTLTGS